MNNDIKLIKLQERNHILIKTILVAIELIKKEKYEKALKMLKGVIYD